MKNVHINNTFCEYRTRQHFACFTKDSLDNIAGGIFK